MTKSLTTTENAELNQLVGANIRMLMGTKNIRAGEIVKRCDISRSGFHSLKEGTAEIIRFQTIKQIAEVFEVDPSVFFTPLSLTIQI